MRTKPINMRPIGAHGAPYELSSAALTAAAKSYTIDPIPRAWPRPSDLAPVSSPISPDLPVGCAMRTKLINMRPLGAHGAPYELITGFSGPNVGS